MSTSSQTSSEQDVKIHYEPGAVQSAQAVKRILPPRLAVTLYGRATLYKRSLQAIELGEPVILHGMAGMGKSALASAIAWSLIEKYPNGVLWIDSGYSPVDAICDSVGQQFEDEQMPKLAAMAKPSRARYLLGSHKVLVVLDNCWDPDVARDFALQCIPVGTGLLVTSREKIARLGTLVEVTALEPKAASNLFKDAAGMKPKNETKEVEQLVELLGCHPQALAIAGALCLEEELSAKQLLEMLGPAEERAKKLKLGKDTSNNVWATFQLSYQRLALEEQIVFRAIGGTWGKSATAEILSYLVVSDTESIEVVLRGLVKRALARIEDLADDRKRYVVHDLVHAFAQGLIKDSGESIEKMQESWLLAEVQYATKYNDDNIASHNALEAEMGNLMGAANWAGEHLRHDLLNSLAGSLCSESSFLFRRGYNAQAVGLLTRAVEAAHCLGDLRSEVKHLGNLGYSYALLSNYTQSIACYDRALKAAQLAGDARDESKWLGLMGLAYDNVSDPTNAIKCYEKAVELDRASGNKAGEGRWLGSLAGTRRVMGEKATAVDLYTQAIEIARSIGDRENEGVHLSNLGNAYRTWGQYETAISYYDAALGIALEIGDRATQARCLANTGRLFAFLGQPEVGLEKCREALDLFVEMGFRSGEAFAHGYIGEVQRVLGNMNEAQQETLKALEIHRAVGVGNAEAEWLHNLGIWAIEDDKKGEGIHFLQEALQIRKKTGSARYADTLKALKEAGVEFTE